MPQSNPNMGVQTEALRQLVEMMSQQAAMPQQAPQMESATQQQKVNALVAGGIHAMNPNAQMPGLAGVAGGLSALQSARQRDLMGRQQQYEEQTKALQQRIDNLGKVAGIAGSIEGQTLGRERFSFEQAGRKRVDLVDNAGGVRGEVLQGDDGRLYAINPQTGREEDVTQQVASQGLLTKPKSSQTISQTVNTGDKAKDALIGDAVKHRAVLRDKANDGRSMAAIADRVTELAPTINTGVGATTLSNFKSILGTALREGGAGHLADRLPTMGIEELNSLTYEQIKPAIEAQGRSFSDADREFMLGAIASARNSPLGNVIIAQGLKAGALNAQEEFAFFEESLQEVIDGERPSMTGVERAYNLYVQDVPRLAPQADGTAKAIDDGRNLWKYWRNGRPNTFVLGSGDVATQADLKATAAARGVSYRELLSELDAKGQILGVRK